MTFQNINFTGSNSHAIYSPYSSAGNNAIIQNCSVSFAGQDGIFWNGANVLIDHNSVSVRAEVYIKVGTRR